jgi:hypothetical protein
VVEERLAGTGGRLQQQGGGLRGVAAWVDWEWEVERIEWVRSRVFSPVGRVGLIGSAGFFLFFISADVVMIEKILNKLSLKKFWHH